MELNDTINIDLIDTLSNGIKTYIWSPQVHMDHLPKSAMTSQQIREDGHYSDYDFCPR